MLKCSELNLKTIMVATDLSSSSYAALKYARDLAAKFSARLLLTHVIDPASPGTSDKAALCGKIDCAERTLQMKLEALAADSIEGRVIVREGNILNTICDLVDERQVDLLVIGTKGQSTNGASGMRSVAETLLRAVPCPVLTVGCQDRMDALDGTKPTKIMVPTDFTLPSEIALEYAERLASNLNAQMYLLHVEDRTAGSEVLSVSGQRSEFTALIAAMKDPSRIREYIMCIGDPADRIVRAADARRVDLLVMRAHERAYDVIRQVRCPVFTLNVTGTRSRGLSMMQSAASPEVGLAAQ